jgi:hypothetical protein
VRKRDELADPNSCLNKAADDEIVFVLRAHDDDTSETIRYWAGRRLLRGKNKLDDAKIREAIQCAEQIEAERSGP